MADDQLRDQVCHFDSEGAGDWESLFGDEPDDSSPSMSIEGGNGFTDDSTSESQHSLPSSSTQPIQPRFPSLLSPPTVPDPPAASVSCQEGHTSGLQVVSTNSTITSPSQSAEDGTDPGRWSNTEVSNAQDINTIPDVGQEHGNQADPLANLMDDLDALMEYEVLKDQAISSTTSAHPDAPLRQESGLSLSQLPDYCYKNAATRRGIRVPQRIDIDESQVEVLVPYIIFPRINQQQQCDRLELSMENLKLMTMDTRDYLHALDSLAPFNVHFKEGKQAVLKCAFRILKNEGWGTKWFGREHGGQPRKLYWPEDSTLIICQFSVFLKVVIDNEKEKKRVREQNQEKLRRRALHNTGDSSVSPIDLSAVSPRPESNAYSRCLQQASQTTTAATPGSPAPSSCETLIGVFQPQLPAPPIPFDALAKQISLTKKRKLREAKGGLVPLTADLTYNFAVQDRETGEEIQPSATYRHSEPGIALDAFSYLASTFSDNGTPASIDVRSVSGSEQRIGSQAEWDAAVRSIWEAKPVAAVVDVTIRI